MTHRPTTSRMALAGLLSLLLLAVSAIPANAAEPKRRAGAEDLTARLVNCMRTGGHVTRRGKCRGRDSGKYSRYVKPLKRSAKVSNDVAWPWARKSVQFYGTRSCWIGHARNGSTIDKRFAAAQLDHIANGENMGCGLYGGAQVTALRLARMWQAEKSWHGWHWRQIKDREFKSFGVGVAKYGRYKAQVVVDFYGAAAD
jgi:hypothetical protein